MDNIENIENNDNKNITILQRKIKHLVISGGSVWGLSAFGIIFEAISSGFLHPDDIKSIYGTSIGALVGLIFALKIDHIILKEYLINRPWELVCKKSMCSVLEIFENKGMIQQTFFIKFFTPLFKSVDLDINITMLDLYNYNGIDFHIFVTELNSFKLVDISYKTHPEWSVLDAIYGSCAIPLLFPPMIKNDECFIDGGFFLNYPISKCIENIENLDEILGISLGNNTNVNSKLHMNSDSNILDLLNVLLNRIVSNIDLFTNTEIDGIPYDIHVVSKETTIEYCLQVLYSKDDRNTLISNGITTLNEKYKEWFS